MALYCARIGGYCPIFQTETLSNPDAMAFSICLGGNMTLMGASSKGVLNGLMESYGLTAFNFFDYTPVGVVLFIIGLLYFAFAGYKLLPVVDVAETAETAQKQVELRTDKMTYAVAAFAS